MQFLQIPAHFAAAGALVWFANWIGLLNWRRAATAHWTERARLLWPARVTAGMNVLVLPGLLGVAHRLLSPQTPDGWIANGLAALLGALLGTYPFEHEIFPRSEFRTWLIQVSVFWALRLSGWLALLAGILLMPAEFGWGTAMVAEGYLLFSCALQFGFVPFLRLVRVLEAPNERLQRLVAQNAERAGMRPPASWILGGAHAYAFALPITRELLFSRRLLEICPDEEISAICAHELAHLGEPKTVLAGRSLGQLTFFPLLFIVPCFHAIGIGVVLLLLPVWLLSRFSRCLAQRLEKRADQKATAAQLDEGVYARALERLYQENQVPAVNVNNRQTHPHLYDRMLAAGVTPDYPRPGQPDRMTWIGYVYWFTLCALCALCGALLDILHRH